MDAQDAATAGDIDTPGRSRDHVTRDAGRQCPWLARGGRGIPDAQLQSVQRGLGDRPRVEGAELIEASALLIFSA
jgi:hypothetical protein